MFAENEKPTPAGDSRYSIFATTKLTNKVLYKLLKLGFEKKIMHIDNNKEREKKDKSIYRKTNQCSS